MPPTMSSGGSKQVVYPFRSGAARHRRSFAYNFPYSAGNRYTVPLDNIGYLSEVQINFVGTVTVGTTGTVTDAANSISNFFPFIGFRSPQGEYVWSTNSRDEYDFSYRLAPVVTPATDPNYAMYSPSSATAQPVNIRYRIPVSLNDGGGFDFGQIMRQISNNQFGLEIGMANTTSDLQGVGTVVITSITGTVYVEEIYYDAVTQAQPGQPQVRPPSFGQYIRQRSLTSPPLVNGLNDVRYDTGPVIADMMHRIINAGAADGTISNVAYMQVVGNKGNIIDNRTGQRIVYDNQQHLAKAMRAGVYHLDFNDDVTVVNETKARDYINSNRAAQLDTLIQYNGTPSGTAVIQSFYREIVTLGA